MGTVSDLRLVTVMVGAFCVTAAGLTVLVSSLFDLRSGVSAVAEIASFSDSDEADNGAVMLSGVFTYQQQRNLSCEYASLHIATSLLGNPISEYDVERVVPLDENPHLGYRGDINGAWGNTDDYGVYAEPLALALAHFGFSGEVYYGGRAELTAQLDLGRPVVVWLGMWGDAGSFDAYTADGARYQLTTGVHVMTAYGYDDGGVYLTDPGTAMLRYYDWGTYLSLWTVMNGMALSVYR